jgi:hypothetical protein
MMDLFDDRLELRVIMGSCERRGAWKVPAQIDAHVTLGSIQLDLRDAELGPDTTIEAHLWLGSLEILVPADVVVEVDVDSVAASVAAQPRTPNPTWHAARRLRVTGKARFASCEIARTES